MKIGIIRVENEKCICDLCHKETRNTLYCGFPQRLDTRSEMYMSTGYDICKDCARDISSIIQKMKSNEGKE